MAITGGFFNSINKDRLYYADQVNGFFEGLVSSGVFENVDKALKVNAGTGLQVQVMPGKLADSKGRWLKNDSILNLTISAADVLLPRYDAIVAALDSSTAKRVPSIYVKKGTTASSPAKPAMTRNEYLEEYCLAYVYVGKGATAITQSAITDTRPDKKVCGWVTGLIKQVDTTTLFDQYQTAYEEDRTTRQTDFDTWFASIKETLATSTLIRSYSSVYTTTAVDETEIPINISQYNKELDILQVYINGLRLVPGAEYETNSNTIITLTKGVDAGTPISFEVFKSIDGSDAETVVTQVYALQQATADSGWLPLPLVSGITEYSNLWTPKYRKIGKEVFLKGAVKGITANNTTIATLPEGFRPLNAHPFAQVTSNAGGNAYFARWQAGTAGSVVMETTSGDAPASGDIFPIDTSFLID